MVTLSGGFRVLFREQIKNFCSENDLKITYRSCLGDCDNYNIGGETYNVDKLIKYVEQLEQVRKNKGFWYSLWNFRNNKLNTVVMCSSCNDVIDLTDNMNNWVVLDKHYCGECYSKLILDNIKSKYV